MDPSGDAANGYRPRLISCVTYPVIPSSESELHQNVMRSEMLGEQITELYGWNAELKLLLLTHANVDYRQ